MWIIIIINIIIYVDYIPVVIQIHPQDQFINNEQTATFECFANGSNNLLTAVWEKDRKLYTSGIINIATHSNGVGSTLVLNRAMVNDSGKYRCRVTNFDRNTTNSNEAELISKFVFQIITS